MEVTWSWSPLLCRDEVVVADGGLSVAAAGRDRLQRPDREPTSQPGERPPPGEEEEGRAR